MDFFHFQGEFWGWSKVDPVRYRGVHNKTHTFWFWVFRNFFCEKFMQNRSIMRQMNVQNESNVLSYWNPNLVRKSSRTVRFTPARYTFGASENRPQNGKNWGQIGVIFSILWTWKNVFFRPKHSIEVGFTLTNLLVIRVVRYIALPLLSQRQRISRPFVPKESIS